MTTERPSLRGALATKQSILPRKGRKLDCFAALAMTCRTQLRILAAHCARGLPLISRPLQTKGAGNAGRPMRPIAACAKVVAKRTRVSRSHRNHPTFPTQWFTAYLALSSVRRAFWPPSSAEYCIRRLDSSVGEPGPHDFARPLWRASSKSASASTAARPALLTLRNAPLWDGMVKDIGLFAVSVNQNIF
jgi:hypothetical protein